MTLFVRDLEIHTAATLERVRRLPVRGAALVAPARPAAAPPVPRATRAPWLLLGAIVAVLFYVAQSAAATQASYEIQALRTEQAQLRADQEQLALQLAQAHSSYEVDRNAIALGLSHPAHVQNLPAVPTAIALAPALQQQRARHDDSAAGVLATILGAFGQPTEVVAGGH